MFEFEKTMKEIERLDRDSYQTVIAEKSGKIISELAALTGGEGSGYSRFLGIVLGAIISDGVLSEKEFLLIKPMLDVAFDCDMTFEEAEKTISFLVPDPKSYKDFVNTMTDLFGASSEALKTDIVTVCALICAADGKISHKEKKWLKTLIK